MTHTLQKTKLTLWVKRDAMKFGKLWAKKHDGSISKLLSDYLYRLENVEKLPFKSTPIVTQLSGVIKDKKGIEETYKKHLKEKYLHA